jgi:hypothetical protein
MNETIMQIINWAYIVWPATLTMLIFTVIPLLVGTAHYVCSWIDDGEKTFKYPRTMAIPFYRAVYDKPSDVDPCAALNAAASLLAAFILAVFYKGFGFVIPLWILLIPLPFILVKKVFKLGKAFSKHVLDKNAHKD